MAHRSPPRKSPISSRSSRAWLANTIIESTFEVRRRFRCAMRVDCDRLDPGAVIRPDPGEWLPRMPKRLDEEELADWRAGRDAVYQLAAHHGRRATRGRRRINGPSNRKPRRGSRGFEVDDRARGKCDRSPDVSKHRRKPSSSTVSDIYNFGADRPADR